jgi:hypothetical protein
MFFPGSNITYFTFYIHLSPIYRLSLVTIVLGDLLYDAFNITDCMSVEWQDDSKIRNNFKGSGRGLIKVLPRHLPASWQVSERRFQQRPPTPNTNMLLLYLFIYLFNTGRGFEPGTSHAL